MSYFTWPEASCCHCDIHDTSGTLKVTCRSVDSGIVKEGCLLQDMLEGYGYVRE